MSNIPSDLLYTADHEYLRATADADVFAVGITHYAQDQLGDIVFVELPRVGATYGAHDTFGTIEAVKAVSELFSPVSGEVVEVNSALDGDPAAINRDPYGDGWMIKIRLSDPSQKATLLDAAGYAKHIGE
ncbi:MAG TPA: glycine cleavage system protein GcvH [Gemmatimonadaceae bacterium]|nr:glycine cleavage system protein GcvH [Gemmatimonadaceae bacterium]